MGTGGEIVLSRLQLALKFNKEEDRNLSYSKVSQPLILPPTSLGLTEFWLTCSEPSLPAIVHKNLMFVPNTTAHCQPHPDPHFPTLC